MVRPERSARVSAAQATRQRLLEAAEQLFADRGIEGASLRDITARAGVNLAGANYHFRTKEGLLEAVIDRRLGPLNDERLRLLAQAEQRAGAGPVPIEELVRALTAPVIALSRDARGGARFVHLAARMHVESGETWLRFMARFETVKQRFLAAFAAALPGLPRAEVAWSLHFAIGALANVAADQQRLEFLSDGQASSRDPEALTRRLVPFLAAGIAARPKSRGRGPALGVVSRKAARS